MSSLQPRLMRSFTSLLLRQLNNKLAALTTKKNQVLYTIFIVAFLGTLSAQLLIFSGTIIYTSLIEHDVSRYITILVIFLLALLLLLIFVYYQKIQQARMHQQQQTIDDDIQELVFAFVDAFMNSEDNKPNEQNKPTPPM